MNNRRRKMSTNRVQTEGRQHNDTTKMTTAANAKYSIGGSRFDMLGDENETETDNFDEDGLQRGFQHIQDNGPPISFTTTNMDTVNRTIQVKDNHKVRVQTSTSKPYDNHTLTDHIFEDETGRLATRDSSSRGRGTSIQARGSINLSRSLRDITNRSLKYKNTSTVSPSNQEEWPSLNIHRKPPQLPRGSEYIKNHPPDSAHETDSSLIPPTAPNISMPRT